MPFYPSGSGTGGGGEALNSGLILHFGPEGNDANDGKDWQTAMKTGYAAYARLADAGGGELHFADTAEWGGPVSGQGIWLRGDGREIDGWQPIVPCRIIGHGGKHTQFGRPGARLIGGSGPFATDRFHPLVWHVASGFSPVVFENILPFYIGNSTAQLGRFGWDYRRKESDDSIALANITNWDRADGSAVLTVAFPETTAITTASRTSNVVTINFAAQQVLTPAVGQWIVVTSTDINFASGEYQVTAVGGTFLRYAETAANIGSTANIGTWATHGVQQYDRIDVVSTDSEVITTQYRVTATTGTTITVTDPYGYAPRSATVSVNNCGQYVLQDRCNYIAGLFDIINVSGSASATVTTDPFINGPVLDFGGTTDGRINVSFGCCNGLAPTTEAAKDPDRGAWMLLDPGSHSASGLTVYNCRNGQTGIRAYGSKVASWGISVIDVNSDSNTIDDSPPALEVLEGGGFGTIHADRVVVWDNPATVPNIRSDASLGSHLITNCGFVDLQGYVTDANYGGRDIGNETESPLARGQQGFWINRISGDSAQPRRAFSARTPRYQNWLQDDPATWVIAAGPEVTTSLVTGPYGATNAVRCTRASGSSGIFLLPQDINNNPHTSSAVTHTVGDTWILGGWFRKDDWTGAGTSIVAFNFAGLNGNFSVTITNPFRGDGEWQWCSAYSTIESVDNSSCGWRNILSVFPGQAGQVIDLHGLFLTRIPNGEMSANEVAEYVQGLQPTEYYHPPGIVGTWKDQKLIAHGGYGTNSANANVVGVGSGQLTLTGVGTVYLPTYDEDGTTIIGWVAQLQATVNP